ncbi:hypothetical protein BDZ45DRAFT_45523 [Acephala macrosclerotiorum]|nr:hypothetical protein BDZ45DRAFT_45523 [Acephala macrosclerotiorum]
MGPGFDSRRTHIFFCFHVYIKIFIKIAIIEIYIENLNINRNIIIWQNYQFCSPMLLQAAPYIRRGTCKPLSHRESLGWGRKASVSVLYSGATRYIPIPIWSDTPTYLMLQFYVEANIPNTNHTSGS